LSDNAVAPLKIIAPGRGGLLGAIAECWRSRELLGFLAWRDIKVRYKQMYLGALWAVLQPLTHMVIFTLIFNKVAGMKSPDGIPYPIYIFAALLPWQLFHSSLSRSSNSVVAEARLLTKVYFPRLLVPFSAVVSGLVDFAISFVILAGMMLYYGLAPGWTALCLPVFVILAIMSALAVGLWLSAMNVKYRDFRYVIPFMLTTWMFITPVAYPASAVMAKLPPAWAWVYNLNPMAGVVEGFRWALLGKSGLAPEMLLVSSVAVVVVFIGGLLYFRKMERSFADIL
jgi:homopolymeric O-antigen transport system permease protein